MDEKIMTIADLIDYLQTLPLDAELFVYLCNGGFGSLDTANDIEQYFKFDESANTLYLDHVRYELENK
ncbi:hypothetical protein CA598_08350 [Paenibacillus sp. VTT E-133291]|nr:hypothetical protein CA598_08350 [Paenibacillus sp. VTT E-133291]